MEPIQTCGILARTIGELPAMLIFIGAWVAVAWAVFTGRM